jgi:hypothetical protein
MGVVSILYIYSICATYVHWPIEFVLHKIISLNGLKGKLRGQLLCVPSHSMSASVLSSCFELLVGLHLWGPVCAPRSLISMRFGRFEIHLLTGSGGRFAAFKVVSLLSFAFMSFLDRPFVKKKR